MKNKFKILARLLIIVSFLTLIGCSEEVYNSHDNSVAANKRQISLLQFKNETKIKNFSTIFKAPISNDGIINRSAELSDFIIDTLAILKHINQNNETTYAFRIYSIAEFSNYNEKYNLIYRKEENTWEKSIFSISTTNSTTGLTSIDTREILFDTKIETSRMASVCISTSTVSHCEGCTGACDWQQNCSVCYRYVVTTITDCGGSGGGPANPSGGGPENPGGGSPLNPFEFTPNIFDNPVFDDPNYINAIKSECFFQHLLPVEQNWASVNGAIYNQILDYVIEQNWSEESCDLAEEVINALINGVDDDKVCVSSFQFTDVGGNWQNAGVSNINIQFLTIGTTIRLQNVNFPQLHFGLPKQQLNGNYITNNNAKYIGQDIMTEAEMLTNAYQAINPTASAITLKSYFLSKIQQASAAYGGTVTTSPPLGWNGTLKQHETYIISSGIECD
jgi:hypothetical protein